MSSVKGLIYSFISTRVMEPLLLKVCTGIERAARGRRVGGAWVKSGVQMRTFDLERVQRCSIVISKAEITLISNHYITLTIHSYFVLQSGTKPLDNLEKRREPTHNLHVGKHASAPSYVHSTTKLSSWCPMDPRPMANAYLSCLDHDLAFTCIGAPLWMVVAAVDVVSKYQDYVINVWYDTSRYIKLQVECLFEFYVLKDSDFTLQHVISMGTLRQWRSVTSCTHILWALVEVWNIDAYVDMNDDSMLFSESKYSTSIFFIEISQTHGHLSQYMCHFSWSVTPTVWYVPSLHDQNYPNYMIRTCIHFILNIFYIVRHSNDEKYHCMMLNHELKIQTNGSSALTRAIQWPDRVGYST